MSSLQMLQFLWPVFQAWLPFALLRRRLRDWSRPRVRRQMSEGLGTPAQAFGQSLRSSVEAALRSTEPNSERITSTVGLFAVPPSDAQALLLRLAGTLVGDALAHSFDPSSVGSVHVSLDRTGCGLQLIVEDDGWQSRSPAAWLEHNRASERLVATTGGWLRRDVEWECNRVVVLVPII